MRRATLEIPIGKFIPKSRLLIQTVDWYQRSQPSIRVKALFKDRGCRGLCFFGFILKPLQKVQTHERSGRQRVEQDWSGTQDKNRQSYTKRKSFKETRWINKRNTGEQEREEAKDKTPEITKPETQIMTLRSNTLHI